MKLHLPSSLRKALLACLAAFAFPVSLPVTVSSGAAAVGAAVVFSVLSSQPLQAATRYTDGLLYSGDIYTYDNNEAGSLNNASGKQWHEDGSEGETLTGSDFYGKFWISNGNATNTLRLAGATSDVAQTADFSGNVWFGGLIAEASDYEYKIWRNSNTTQQINFQAEEGRMVYASLQSSVYFDAKYVHLNSDADWRIAAGKTFTIVQRSVADFADKAFTIADGKTLTLRAYNGEEGGTFILQGMEMKLGAGAKLVVNQGASAELGSDVKAGGTSEAIEVNGGSLEIAGSMQGNFLSVEVNDGELSVGGNTGNRSQIGSLSVNGGSATLESLQYCYGNVSATEGGKIVVNDTTDWVTITGGLIADNGSISFVGEVRARNGNITIANGGKMSVGIPEESESFALYVSGSFSSTGGVLSVDEGDIVVTKGGSLSSSSVDIGSSSVNVSGATFEANTVSIGTGAINVSEGGAFTASKLSGTLTSISVVGADSKVKLGEGSALSLVGEVNVSEGGVLEIGDNSVITVDVSAGGHFVLGETTSLQGTPDIIVLLPQDIDVGWEYQLFEGKVPAGLNVNVGVASDMPRGLMVGYDEKTGWISISGEETHSAELVWTGGNYTWKTGSDQWLTDEDDKRFYMNDNVTFIGDEESVVTVVDTVKPGKMTVSGTAYTFVGGSIEVRSEDGIEITEGAGVAFETESISASKITVGKDAVAGFVSGSVHGGTMEISKGAIVTIATEEEKSFTEGVTLEQGATLRIENKANWAGAVSGEGTLELSIGGLETGISADAASRENVLGDEGSLASMLPGGEHHISTVRLVDNSLLQVTASAQHGQFSEIGNLVVTEGSVLTILSTRGQNNKDEHGFGSAKNTLTIEGDGGAWEDDQGSVYEGALLFGVGLSSSDTSHYLNSNVALSGDASVYVDAAGSRTGVLSDFEDGGSYTSAGHTLTINGGGTLMLGKYFHTEEGDVAGVFKVKAGSLRLNYTAGEALSGYHIHLAPGTQLGLGGGERTSAYTIGSLSGNGQVELYTDGAEPSGATRELRFRNDFDACGDDNEYTGSLAEGVVVHMQQGYQAIHSTVSGAYVEMLVSGGTLDLNGVDKVEEDDEPDYDGDLGYDDDDSDAVPSIAYGANIANNTVLNVTVGAEPEPAADETEPSLASAENATLLMQNIGIGQGATVSLDLKNGGYADLSRAHAEENARLEIRSAGAAADLSEITTEGGVALSLELTEGSYADLSRAELGEDNTLSAEVQASELHMSGLAVGSASTLALGAAEGGLVQLSGASFAEQSQVSVVSTGSTVNLGSTEFATATELNVQATDGSVSLAGAVFEAALTLPVEDDGDEVETIPGAKVQLTLAGGSHDLSNISAGEGVTLEVDLQRDALARFTNTFPASGLHLMVHGTNSVVQDLKMGVGTRIEAEDALLTLAGMNNILLDSSMADNEALRIFSASVRRLALVDGARLSVDISGVLSDIMGEGGQEAKFYIAENDLNAWKDQLSFGAELALLNLKVSLGIDGSLSFQALGVDNDTVYWSSRDNVKGNYASNRTLWNAGDDVYASTDSKVAVYVDCDTFLNLRGGNPGYREDGLVLNNLMGANGATLYMTGDGTGLSKVTIANNLSRSGLNTLEDVLGVRIEDVLTFDGNIDVKGVDVQLKHRDGDSGAASEDSTTLLKGKLTMSDGELQMTSGKLELAGAGSDLNGGISFAGNDAQLVVEADTRIGGHIYLSGSGELDTTRQEHILLNNADASITLNDGAHVGAGVVIGNAFDELFAEDEAEPMEGDEVGGMDGEQIEEAPVEQPQQPVELYAGTLNVEQGSQQMENGSRLSNVLLNLETGSAVTVIGAAEEEAPAGEEIAPMAAVWEEEETPRVPADWAIAGLTGEGALASDVEHQIDICVAGKDRSFSGDLSGYHGTMTVLASDNTQYFDGVTGGSGWNLTNTEGGRVEINLMGGSAPNHLTMGNLTLQAGSYTTILFDIPSTLGSNALLTLQGLTIEDGADVTLGQYKGTISLRGTDGVYSRVLGTISVEEDNIFIGEDVNWHLKGIRNAADAHLTVDANGNLLLEAEVSNKNGFADFADNENSTTGANLLWDVQNTYQIGGDLADLDSLLYDLIITVDDVTAENNRAEANRVMAAVAGSSTAVMSEAVSTDMERQLRSIRNRTTSLAYSGDSYSRIHSGAWVNAESNYHKQEADGMLPGYKVNGWGGTVGAHTQVGESATVGIALTAMYNDLESDGPDHLKGDMDTYYLTGFVQVAHEAWRHTFVLSIGRANLDVDRTVAYADGGYTTKGSTDGVGFGALYELGYTIPLNVDYSVCLQPVFNVSWRLNELGAYTETGSNAALHIEEQTYNAVTFGAGARLQTAVGTNVWNRTGIFESRALLKVDVGDRQGKSAVALQEAGSFRGNVKSAEKGAVGVELGAGLALPTGRRGEVFVDGSAELRADYTNLNATIGYRINF